MKRLGDRRTMLGQHLRCDCVHRVKLLCASSSTRQHSCAYQVSRASHAKSASRLHETQLPRAGRALRAREWGTKKRLQHDGHKVETACFYSSPSLGWYLAPFAASLFMNWRCSPTFMLAQTSMSRGGSSRCRLPARSNRAGHSQRWTSD